MANVEQERAKRMGEAVSSGLAVTPKEGGAVGMVRPEQRRALELLVDGSKDVTEIALEVGKSRTTIYTWLKEDAVFAAAYNQWVGQLEFEAKAQSRMLLRKAGVAVEKALEAGDGRLGLRLLEKMGIVKEREVGPTEAGEVEMERKVAKKKKDLERRKLEAEIRESEMNPFL